jgi:hypothetical protein
MSDLKKSRDMTLAAELKLRILQTIHNFKSKEHPRMKVKHKHIAKALSSLLDDRIDRLK